MADRSVVPDSAEGLMTYPTTSDLSALRYHFVKLDANELVVACGANEKPLGILENAPDGSSVKASAAVRISGPSKLKLDEAVAFGNFLTCTAASQGEVADAAGEEYGAKALSSGDDGDIIAVLVTHGEVNAADA